MMGVLMLYYYNDVYEKLVEQVQTTPQVIKTIEEQEVKAIYKNVFQAARS